MYGEYKYEGDFPIPIPLTPTEKRKCKNEDLKKEGIVYVQTEAIHMLSSINYRFTASSKRQDPDAISELKGKPGGICDQVATRDEKNQGCGLAKYLMATCFQENTILGDDERGVDVRKDVNWDEQPEISHNAISYCKTITHLHCKPYGDPTPPSRVCISYLRAGSLANFNILFSQKHVIPMGPLNAFKLGESLEAQFNNNADKFISDYGNTWYFCKCKEDMMEKCMVMAENNP